MKRKVTKRAARYHAASHYCGRCVFYRTRDRATGLCARVTGVVEYDAGCVLFRARR